ncbi:helix-turn-helix transcriptional regulator [Desulfobacter vibrioformis]|uniref:helix-turn-helix transcriptional regulator n=1 Tax=Desulfobacter vibrioformis TaxID=34031 RepID=UPI00068FA933|nr:AraC family transcriptional regulator [Desulfobacter vibrioformis]
MNESRLFEQFQCYGRRPDREGNETVLTLSRAIGEGYRREIPLGPGLKLYLENYTLKEQLSARVVPEKCPLGISLCISGRLNWIPDRPGPVPAYRTLSGQFDISVSGSDMDDGFIECMPHEPIRLISLLIEPDRLPCRAVHADIMESLPFASPASRTQLFSYMKHHLNPSMDMAARQLMNCRLTGISKTFYLTAKSLEIIALALGSLENASTFLSALPPGHGRRVGSREKEALYQVRHILDQQYPDPPSLAQLARQTGLNQTKLKKGFKLLFNTTISSYVLTRRMEKGHDLLKKGETTVSEVAYKVGYANRAHFTRAFTRQFGYPPVDLLRHDLRDNPRDSV